MQCLRRVPRRAVAEPSRPGPGLAGALARAARHRRIVVAVARRWLADAAGAPSRAHGGWCSSRVPIVRASRSRTPCSKALEEPGDRHVFILVADEVGRLLPTIRSRSQPLRIGTGAQGRAGPLAGGGPRLDPVEADGLPGSPAGSAVARWRSWTTAPCWTGARAPSASSSSCWPRDGRSASDRHAICWTSRRGDRLVNRGSRVARGPATTRASRCEPRPRSNGLQPPPSSRSGWSSPAT